MASIFRRFDRRNRLRDREDKILNPLNSIILLTHGTAKFKEVEKEVKRIVTVLEQEKLINKRESWLPRS